MVDACTAATSWCDRVSSVISQAAAIDWIIEPSCDSRFATQIALKAGLRNGASVAPGAVSRARRDGAGSLPSAIKRSMGIAARPVNPLQRRVNVLPDQNM